MDRFEKFVLHLSNQKPFPWLPHINNQTLLIANFLLSFNALAYHRSAGALILKLLLGDLLCYGSDVLLLQYVLPYIYIYIYIYIYTHTHTHTYIYVYVCVRVRVCVCVS